jgi:hypothetical protein
MKSILLSGGIQTFISVTESELISTHGGNVIKKEDLSEREQVIAHGLVRKGVFERRIRDGKTYYTSNKI